MLDGEDTPPAEGEVVDNLTGTPSFQVSAPLKDPMRPSIEPKPAPEGVPEKFWDADKGEVRLADLVKSYGELESKLGQPKEPVDPADPADPQDPADPAEPAGPAEPADPKDPADPADPADPQDPVDPEAVELTAAMEVAQTAYAETGVLSEEVRAPFLKAGISNERIDLYIQGVKAQEAGIKSAAMKAAGVDDYVAVEKAIEWAATNWSEKKILAFNAQAGDVETVGGAVTALFKDYQAAEPGEGRLANINSGANRGDVYTDRAEFDRDLAKSLESRDQLARKVAIAKMGRSIKAGSLKKK